MLRAAALATLLLAACGEPEPVCQNELIREALSPDGALKAVLFKRACGGPTGMASQVSILAANEIEAGKGNTFIVDSAGGAAPAAAWGGPDIQFMWTGPRALTLSYHSRSRIIASELSVRGIAVSHAHTD